MDIRNRRAVRSAASEALAANPGDPRMVALIYIAVSAASSLLVSVLVNILSSRINETGGLSGMGLRSILSTIRTCLPLAQMVAMWGVQLGYQKATVHMARRQAVHQRNLLEGFSHFGPLVRSFLLRGGLYVVLALGASYAATFVFMLTPLSADFYALVEPMVTDPDAFYAALSTDDALFAQVGAAIMPMMPIMGVIFLAVAAPIFYQYRMVNYCILEQRGKGALAAMAESARMMKGHRVELLKLDLGYWWYYLAQVLLMVLLYGDVVLPLVGVTLPWSAMTSYYVFYIAYLVLQGGLYYLCLNRVETTYATVYEMLRPKPRANQGGAVLGNIFDLAREYREN